MAKKAKKRIHPMPKLGWQDRLLYTLLIVVTFGGALACLFFLRINRDRLLSADALTYEDDISFMYGLFLFFFLLTVGIIVILGPCRKRIPVFGRKGVRYGPPAYPRVFPLLMKNKPQYWESASKIKKRKKRKIILTVFLVCSFLLSTFLYSRSLCGRYELMNDGSVKVFDYKNRETEHYKSHQIQSVCVSIYRSGGHRSVSYNLGMFVSLPDGEEYLFRVDKFGDDWNSALRQALSLKDRYGVIFSAEDEDDFWKFFLYNHLTPQEKELLYQLFETS